MKRVAVLFLFFVLSIASPTETHAPKQMRISAKSVSVQVPHHSKMAPRTLFVRITLVDMKDALYRQYAAYLAAGIMGWAKVNNSKLPAHKWQILIEPTGWGQLKILIYCRELRKKIHPAALTLQSCEDPLDGVAFVAAYIQTLGHPGRLRAPPPIPANTGPEASALLMPL